MQTLALNARVPLPPHVANDLSQSERILGHVAKKLAAALATKDGVFMAYFPLLLERAEPRNSSSSSNSSSPEQEGVRGADVSGSGTIAATEKIISSARGSPVDGWVSYPGHTKCGELRWMAAQPSLLHTQTFTATALPSGGVNVVLTLSDGFRVSHFASDMDAVFKMAAHVAQRPCSGSTASKSSNEGDVTPKNMRLVARRIEIASASAMISGGGGTSGGGGGGAHESDTCMLVCYPESRDEYYNNKTDAVVFRDRSCTGLSVEGGRCKSCKHIRRRLQLRCTRAAEAEEAEFSHPCTSYKTIASSPRKSVAKLKSLSEENRRLKRAVRQFQRMVTDDTNHTEREAVVVKNQEQAHKIAVLLLEANEKSEALDKQLPPGSKERAVWDDQVANTQKLVNGGGSRHGFRYSGTAIRLGIALLAKCGKATYEELRQIFLCLPSGRHLLDFKGNSTSTGVLEENLTLLQAKVAIAVAELRDRGTTVSTDAESAIID
jgi:hypothetical protein